MAPSGDEDEDSNLDYYVGLSDMEFGDEDSENEESNPNDSTLKNWKDVSPEKVSFSVNKGRQTALDQAKTELKHVVQRLQDLTKSKSPTTHQIIDLFFGDDAEFGHEICKGLGLKSNDENYPKFMQTFVVQNIMTKDSTNFYNILKRTLNQAVPNENVPLDQEEYNAFWEKLANFGRNRSDALPSTRPTPLWEFLQVALNRTFRSIAIECIGDKICIVIDDDKIWLDNTGSNATDRFKLKIVRHTRDNRNGLNAHTLVLAGFLIPVNVQFEMEGDSPMICFKRGMNQLVPEVHSQYNTETYTDRGYTDKAKVDRTLMKGGDVVATVMRQPAWGFTYDQYLKTGDKRKLLNMKGCASQHVKKQKLYGKELTLSAFNNGTGTIAMAISSKHKGHSWEGVPLNDKWKYPTQLDFLNSVYIHEDIHEIEAKAMLLEHLETYLRFYTIQQGTADWHLLRKFSFSSSQAWQTFSALFKRLYSGSEKTNAECVAKTVQGQRWKNHFLKLHERSEDGAIIDISKEEERFLQYFKSHSEEPFDSSDPSQQWRQFVYDLYHDVLASDEMLTEAVALNRIATLDASQLRLVHESLRKRVVVNSTQEETINANEIKKDIIDFLTTSNANRKYLFHSQVSLLRTCSKYGLKAETKNRANTLIRRLLTHEQDDSCENTLPQDYQDSSKQNGIKKLLQQSFQANFKGARKAACQIGHKNEPVILGNFAKDANKGNLSTVCGVVKVLAIFSTGLVARADMGYMKDSIDAIAIVQKANETEQEVWGVEVKTRVSVSEMNKEIDFQDDVPKKSGQEESIYSAVEESELHSHVRRLTERTQILHHAQVYKLNTMLFLVGDKNGRILAGNVISLSENLLNSYESVQRYMYQDILAWAYKDEIPSRELKMVTAIAKTIPTIGGSGEFLSQFHLWRHISRKERLPLPPLKRMLPSIHATWNAFKSGSDTTTKIIENYRFKHPHTNCNSRATHRLLLLSFVFIHRCIQATSCNVETHSTLQGLRDAATQRNNFYDTLEALKEYFKARALKCQQLQAGVPQDRDDTVVASRRSPRINEPLLLKYTTPRTLTTPTRNFNRNRIEGNDPYWQRVYKCRAEGGLPIFVQYLKKPKTRPLRCWDCGKETHSMCFFCRRPLCHTRITIKEDELKENEKLRENTFMVKPITNLDQKKKDLLWYGVKTCFMKEHMGMIKEEPYIPPPK